MHYRKPMYRWIYLAAFFLSLHYAFTIYINSSFLAQFFNGNTIELIYTAGALVTLFGLIASTRVLKQMKLWTITLTMLSYEIVSLIFLTFVSNPAIIAILAIIHLALPPLILFSLDLFLEGTIRDGHNVGTVRSNYLTCVNVAFLISPILVGKIIDFSSYRIIYALSAIFSAIVFLFIADMFARIRIRKNHEADFADAVRKFVPRKNLVKIFTASFLLQVFYTIMVIFTPLYLNKIIGMSWSNIGIVFTIMLLPFVLFEAPLGRVFDKYRNERDVVVAGFLLMAVSVIAIFYTHTPSLVVWAIILFTSRVGASFVEIGSDAVFFRHVTDTDAGFISIFRMGVPLAYVIAPLLAGLLTTSLPFVFIFPALGVIMLAGALISYRIR